MTFDPKDTCLSEHISRISSIRTAYQGIEVVFGHACIRRGGKFDTWPLRPIGPCSQRQAKRPQGNISGGNILDKGMNKPS